MDEIASHYASALYELLPEGKREEGDQALALVCHALEESEDLRKALCSYAFSTEEKEKALDALFPALADVPHVLPFLKIVARNHRFGDFPAIASSFHAMLNADFGVKEGIAYSAFPLSEEEKAALEEAFSRKLGAKVELMVVMDPHLIGGVKVALEGKVYDGTVKNRLSELRARLKNGGNAQ